MRLLGIHLRLVGVIAAVALWAGSAIAAEPALTDIPASEDSMAPGSDDAIPTEPIQVPVATPTKTIATPTKVAATATTPIKAVATSTATGTAMPAAAATSTTTAAATATATPNDETPGTNNYVVLQGLNKVTGHVSKLDGPVGTVMNFGELEIIVRRCWKSSPEERPENAALIEIRELKPEEGPKNVFLGWMFSSSPGLSGLEHAVYDVTLLSCESLEDPEKGDKPTATATSKPQTASATTIKSEKTIATATTKKSHAATATTKLPAATATATKPAANQVEKKY